MNASLESLFSGLSSPSLCSVSHPFTHSLSSLSILFFYASHSPTHPPIPSLTDHPHPPPLPRPLSQVTPFFLSFTPSPPHPQMPITPYLLVVFSHRPLPFPLPSSLTLEPCTLNPPVLLASFPTYLPNPCLLTLFFLPTP